MPRKAKVPRPVGSGTSSNGSRSVEVYNKTKKERYGEYLSRCLQHRVDYSIILNYLDWCKETSKPLDRKAVHSLLLENKD